MDSFNTMLIDLLGDNFGHLNNDTDKILMAFPEGLLQFLKYQINKKSRSSMY